MDAIIGLGQDGLAFLGAAVTATAGQLLLLVPGFVLGSILYYLTGLVKNLALGLWGLGFFYFTAIGVAVHELGHAVFALLFGHVVTRVNLFGPDPGTGAIGYVRHRWDGRNLFQNMGNFFIAMGPLILGSIVIYLAARLLMGGRLLAPLASISVDPHYASSLAGLGSMLRSFLSSAQGVLFALVQPANLRLWQFYAFLYVALAVGSNMHLSPADLLYAWSGFVALVIAMLLANLITLLVSGLAGQYASLVIRTLGTLYGFMLVAIVLSAAFLVLLYAFVLVRDVDRGSL